MSGIQLMTPDYVNSSYISHFPGIEDRASANPIIQTSSPIESSKPETGGKTAPKKVKSDSVPKSTSKPNILGAKRKMKL